MTPYYEEAGIQIWHGDCREVLPVLPFSAEMLFADPPYGVGMKYGEGYDDGDGSGYQALIDEIVPLIEHAAPLKLVTPGIRNLWSWPRASWVLAWNKPGSPRRSDSGGFNIWEPVLVYGKHRIWQDACTLPAWNNTSGSSAEGHPCPKPLQLMRWLVQSFTVQDDRVLDPFMGSGTTLRAAKDLGRRAVGIEIEERYCEIAARRLAQEVLAL